MEIITKAILTVCVVLFVRFAWKALNWVWLKPKKMEKYLKEQGVQGPSYKFLYGNVKEFLQATNEAKSKPMEYSHKIVPRVMPFIQSLIQKYGKITYIWLGTTPRVIITDPDMLRDIFSEKFSSFIKSTASPLGRLLVTGIVRLEGDEWAKHRKIINPAFHLEKLKLMLPAFYISCSEMITKWETAVGEGSAELDVYPFMKKLTADVISRTAFGSSYEDGQKIFELQTEQAKLVMQASQSINIPGFMYLPTKNNRRMKEIAREVRTILRDMIIKREKATEAGEVLNNDLLGLLLESNLQEIKEGGNAKKFGITIDEVIEECKLFYFAGQDTTMNLLNWTMITLSMHKEWQEIARKEVLQVFGSDKPDFDGLKHLKQVTMILNEVLRLYPPISYLTRATSEKVKLGEVILPEGTEIIIPTLAIHHDKKLWGEDADEFKPERFIDGIAKATNNKVSFIPLGWGPRICIGQNFTFIEAKMAIAMILQKFSFELSSNYVHAPYTVITLQPQHGNQIVLHKL